MPAPTERKKSAQDNVPFAIRNYTPEQLREVLRKMHLIRKFEAKRDQYQQVPQVN